ncbi:MAG TPA: cytochrome c [Flavisolibacter sp.]|nr:cytochrome c [Flavisolibacter sp.]
MRNSIIVAFLITLAVGFASCGAGGDDPGSSYMPDMYYSRAYESYNYNNVGNERENLKQRGINYTAVPVPGTIARGDKYFYHLTGDSAGLAAAQGITNPLDTLAVTPQLMKDAERLYLINCGICHGSKLDGNGPLWNNGEGPYAAKPQDLIGYGRNLTDGHFYHVITFGIRTMGSYSSQLTPEQRWWVIKYIRSVQSKTGGAKPAAGDTAVNTAATMQAANKSTTAQ